MLSIRQKRCIFKSQSFLALTEQAQKFYANTVKASNFIVLVNENIFFRQTFKWLPSDFFRHWNLYSKDLGLAKAILALGTG